MLPSASASASTSSSASASAVNSLRARDAIRIRRGRENTVCTSSRRSRVYCIGRAHDNWRQVCVCAQQIELASALPSQAPVLMGRRQLNACGAEKKERQRQTKLQIMAFVKAVRKYFAEEKGICENLRRLDKTCKVLINHRRSEL